MQSDYESWYDRFILSLKDEGRLDKDELKSLRELIDLLKKRVSALERKESREVNALKKKLKATRLEKAGIIKTLRLDVGLLRKELSEEKKASERIKEKLRQLEETPVPKPQVKVVTKKKVVTVDPNKELEDKISAMETVNKAMLSKLVCLKDDLMKSRRKLLESERKAAQEESKCALTKKGFDSVNKKVEEVRQQAAERERELKAEIKKLKENIVFLENSTPLSRFKRWFIDHLY